MDVEKFGKYVETLGYFQNNFGYTFFYDVTGNHEKASDLCNIFFNEHDSELITFLLSNQNFLEGILNGEDFEEIMFVVECFDWVRKHMNYEFCRKIWKNPSYFYILDGKEVHHLYKSYEERSYVGSSKCPITEYIYGYLDYNNQKILYQYILKNFIEN